MQNSEAIVLAAIDAVESAIDSKIEEVSASVKNLEILVRKLDEIQKMRRTSVNTVAG